MGNFKYTHLLHEDDGACLVLKFSTIPGSFAQEAGLVLEGRPEPGTFPGRRVLGSECQASRWLSVRMW